MRADSIKHIYFVGIGGIGMSALARFFKHAGAHVSGYDRTATPLTEALINEGIPVHYDDEPSLIPQQLDLAVYTPAVPAGLNEMKAIRERNIPLKKRAEVLESITENHQTIAVAGTHGKTTITSMISHILVEAGVPITAFIGGIANNFGSNLVLSHHSKYVVVEADEYDKSFLRLHPSMAVVSSMDADHLDIYHSHSQLTAHFQQFASQTKARGSLIHRSGLPLQATNSALTYGFSPGDDFFADRIRIEAGQFVYDWHFGDEQALTVKLQVPGRHNIENALAASTVALEAGIRPDTIAAALGSYAGVARRFDRKVQGPRHQYIDDYAHHPAELDAAIGAARELFPDKKITGIFQPHLFTRTRDFLDGFAQILSKLDVLMLLDIYPAREEPIPGITSKTLLDACTLSNKHLLSKTEVAGYVLDNRPEVLLTLGAGDIDQLVEPLTKLIKTW